LVDLFEMYVCCLHLHDQYRTSQCKKRKKIHNYIFKKKSNFYPLKLKHILQFMISQHQCSGWGNLQTKRDLKLPLRKQVINALFCVTTQPVLVIPYRRFRTP